MASGVLTATGAAEEVVINERADLSLVFGGTGSVKLQRFKNDEWRDVPGGVWTAHTEDIINSGRLGTRFRLNCTARSHDIDWELG